jgi:predicted TIM-barrel enzyme
VGKDSTKKNMERVQDELKALAAEYKSIIKRFRYVTLIGMKSRVPLSKQGMGYPDNNELLHLLTAFVEETFQKAPRVSAYVFIVCLTFYVTTRFT